ncbi:MAG: hypothetical protein IJS09_06470 [Treponema sp.]|nr:hypothetical protein [Treponema sp.]
MTRVKIAVFSIIISFFSVAFADVFPVPEYGYVIDFPEGFSLEDGTEDLSMLLFKHTMLPVQVLVKVWGADSYSSADAALRGTFSKVGGNGDVAFLQWRNRMCAVAKMTLQNAALEGEHGGWSCVIPLAEKKGWLTVLAYAPSKVVYDCEQFLLSILDAVMTDRGSYKDCGIVTSYAYPAGVKKELTLNIGGKKIKTQIGGDDDVAAQFVIDREWAVFTLFVDTPFAIEAWQRFYRMVARDSMGRTKKIAFDIQNALLADAQKTDAVQPYAAIAQELLHWTQGFKYDRASQTVDKADFAPLPLVLEGGSSDCDSRSMLLAVLLRHMGVDACMFISAEYSHAMLGVAFSEKQGQTIHVDGIEYLVGETTAKNLTLGMMDASMQDRDKWYPVMFYD